MLFEGRFVADEIVIDKKYIAAPPCLVNSIQFRDHLLRCLVAWKCALEQCRDIAEFTIERASSGILNAYRGVVT